MILMNYHLAQLVGLLHGGEAGFREFSVQFESRRFFFFFQSFY